MVPPNTRTPQCHRRLRLRLSVEKQIIRIAVEPTGGYEKPLVKALRGAGLPVEMVHTSRFASSHPDRSEGQVRY